MWRRERVRGYFGGVCELLNRAVIPVIPVYITLKVFDVVLRSCLRHAKVSMVKVDARFGVIG